MTADPEAAAKAAVGEGINVKPLVPKQGGRIATLENDVKQLKTDMEKLKRVVASLMMSNPAVQQKLQDMLISQFDQGDSELS